MNIPMKTQDNLIPAVNPAAKEDAEKQHCMQSRKVSSLSI
jgi:hypothetical protein